MIQSKRPSYQEVFERDAPRFMSIGMTYDQYWHGDVRMTRAFVEADRLRQERSNAEAWLSGMYSYDALCCAIQNAFRKRSDPPSQYPGKPYDIFPKKETKQEREAREEAERLQAKIYMQQMMRAGKNWGGSK